MSHFTTPATPLMDSNSSLVQRILPDILAFAIGLGVAYFLKWETRDLVWSLWLCSLVLGYLTLLSALAGGAYRGYHIITHNHFKESYRLPAILMGIVAGLFFLVFFSIHFGGFHAGHSVFLQHFFPIEEMPDDGFGEAFMNPPLLWALVLKHLMLPYGLFLVPAIIAERHHLLMPLKRAAMMVRMRMTPEQAIKQVALDQKHSHSLGDAMGRPYINVIRMHLLIFFFAFSHALKLDSFLVYAVVYFVYFFPWSEARKLNASRNEAGAPT